MSFAICYHISSPYGTRPHAIAFTFTFPSPPLLLSQKLPSQPIKTCLFDLFSYFIILLLDFSIKRLVESVRLLLLPSLSLSVELIPI